MKEIDLTELQRITNHILDHLIKEKGVRSVPLTRDLYWSVPTESLYSPEKPQVELDIGSLYDDWELLKTGGADPSEVVPFQLTELAPLLRFVGETWGTGKAADPNAPKERP